MEYGGEKCGPTSAGCCWGLATVNLRVDQRTRRVAGCRTRLLCNRWQPVEYGGEKCGATGVGCRFKTFATGLFPFLLIPFGLAFLSGFSLLDFLFFLFLISYFLFLISSLFLFFSSLVAANPAAISPRFHMEFSVRFARESESPST